MKTSINIIFPVLNEEKRLRRGIVKTVQFFERTNIAAYMLTIIDNGSVDKTEEIAEELCNQYEHVYYIKIEEKGVGAAFREGVRVNTCDIVGYMDIDLSTDIRHLKQVMQIFDNYPLVQIINASRLNRKSVTVGRKWYRNLTSYGLTFLLKLFLQMKATDSICGFKFFRKDAAEQLIQEAGNRENGWFYIIELLLRAERKPMVVRELPVRWIDDYETTVNVIKLIRNYLCQIGRLFIDIHIKKLW